MSVSKNSIYAFVNVRQPKAIDINNSSGLHILYDSSQSSGFHDDLLSVLDDADPLASILSEASDFEATSNHYNTIDNLYSVINWYVPMRDYINENIDSLVSATLEAKFESELGGTLNAYITQSGYSVFKNKLWDTLFLNMILGTNEELIEVVQQVLRQLNMIELLVEDESLLLETNAGLAALNNSQIVLPQPVFPIPKSAVTETPQSGSLGSVQDQSLILQDIEKHESAAIELVQVFKIQLAQNALSTQLTESEFCNIISYDQDSIPAYTPLDPADCKALYTKHKSKKKTLLIDQARVLSMSVTTRDILTNFGIADTQVLVPFVLDCINQHVQAQYDSLNVDSNNQRIMMVGGALVSILSTRQFGLIDYQGDPSIDITGRPFATPLGVGDLMIVTEELKRYEMGEIAHLENIMSGESKTRTHRNLKITEQEEFEESSYEVETENDTQSTERFEIANEISEMTSQQQETSAGIQVTGSYGAVRATATANFASQNSSLQSSLSASREAREITERASRRVTEKTVRGRRNLTINEIEVTNEHVLANLNPEAHFVGMYHWVNKVLKARTINKGKRLMYEFFVPEPAAFYIFSQVNAMSSSPTLTKPKEPFQDAQSGQINDFRLINRYNYGTWAAKYDVTDIATPPQQFITVSKSFSKDLPSGTDYLTLNDDGIVIPEGYRATNAKVAIGMSGGTTNYVTINIAGQQLHEQYTGTFEVPFNNSDTHTGVVPVSFRSRGTQWAVNVVVECILTDKAYDDWRLETYNLIMESYQSKLSIFEASLEDLKEGVEIAGRNPRLNREIEKTELKKACIKLFSGQRFENFNAMSIVQEIDGPNGPVSFPDFDFIESMQEGQIAMFFEEAFEWDNITYSLYPYYYARKAQWLSLMGVEDPDMKFEKFLKAGAARVVVPVKPEYTKRVLYYTETGTIWTGDNIPALSKLENVRIVDEVEEANATFFEEEVGEPWDLVVPTNLVYLNPDVTPDLPNYE